MRAARRQPAPRLHGAPVAAPLRVRVVHRDEPAIAVTPARATRAARSARAHVAGDLAADIVALLSSGAESRSARRRHDARASRPPGHVAVLVRTNRNAALVRDALDAVGVPAVINGAGSVFGTPAGARVAARCWRRIERPASPAARPRRGADAVPRLDAPSSVAAADERRLGGASTAACTTGRACCATRASRR